jgi:hypothetical protein
MNTGAGPKDTHTGRAIRVLSSFAEDIDLVALAGLEQGARMFKFTGGNLTVVDDTGTEVTLPEAIFADDWIVAHITEIKASGTTATSGAVIY